MRIIGLIAFITGLTVTSFLLFHDGGDDDHDRMIGAMVNSEPLQTSVTDPTPWMYKTYRVTPLAQYDITAQVLSIEYYRYGREANLSPVDFALGWGPMSDADVNRHFTVVQHDRWCTWRAKRSPITMEELLTHSANVHMIPSNEAMMTRLGEVNIGDIVRFRGKLVEAQGSDGWTWTSSLVRNDQGERSCEIIWVEDLEIISHPQG